MDLTVQSPFHAGELEVQQRSGVDASIAKRAAVAIRKAMPNQHREFFANLRYIFVSSANCAGDLSASVLFGPPGFLNSPDPAQLVIKARPQTYDPLLQNLATGSYIGLLGLDFTNRRRNRLNGIVTAVDETGFVVAVHQSFGNCPKYIQIRDVGNRAKKTLPTGPRMDFVNLTECATRVIKTADTFFVASCIPSRFDGHFECDMSHRGGRPGFVDVNGNVIAVPDFSGNLYFNTLGNFMVHPHAALLFIDFATGDLVHVSGRVEVVWGGPEIARYNGAQKAWRLTIERGFFIQRAAKRLVAQRLEFSSHTLETGLW